MTLKLYALAFTALRRTAGGNLSQHLRAGNVLAVSEEKAIGIAYAKSREFYPIDVFFNHLVNAMEVSQGTLEMAEGVQKIIVVQEIEDALEN